jgi:hypothetical protein
MLPKIAKLKPESLKPKLPHQIKDAFLTFAQMPLQMENYVGCKDFGKTF